MNRISSVAYVATGMVLGAVVLWTCASAGGGSDGGPSDGLAGVPDAFAAGPTETTRVRTADTDITAMRTGFVQKWDTEVKDVGFVALADGPLVLTDISDGGIFVAADCAPPTGAPSVYPENWAARRIVGTDGTDGLEGARYPVFANERLCFYGDAKFKPYVSWAGFVPYE